MWRPQLSQRKSRGEKSPDHGSGGTIAQVGAQSFLFRNRFYRFRKRKWVFPLKIREDKKGLSFKELLEKIIEDLKY